MVHSVDNENTYILSGDVIKNFRFDSIGEEEIDLDTGSAFNNKLIFETQPIWNLNRDDIHLTYNAEVNGLTYLYYKTVMKNKINIYTNVKLNQMGEKFAPVTEQFEAGKYRHSGLFGDRMYGWTSYIDWEHWDFGDIRSHNLEKGPLCVYELHPQINW